jgi:hypothetical protein
MFETKGKIPEWQMLYEAFPKEIDAKVSYESMSTVLGRDIRESRSALYKAIRALEANDHRTLVVETNAGYRVAKPAEHEHLGRRMHRKSVRAMARSRNKFASADRSLLTPEVAARMDQLQAKVDELEHHVRYLSIRADRQEAATASVNVKVDTTTADLDAKIAAIQETLRRHGMTN